MNRRPHALGQPEARQITLRRPVVKVLRRAIARRRAASAPCVGPFWRCSIDANSKGKKRRRGRSETRRRGRSEARHEAKGTRARTRPRRRRHGHLLFFITISTRTTRPTAATAPRTPPPSRAPSTRPARSPSRRRRRGHHEARACIVSWWPRPVRDPL